MIKRMGQHTLAGSIVTEAGGILPFYMCTAWAGPWGSGDAGSSLSEDAAKCVEAAFPCVLDCMCYIMNSPQLSGLCACKIEKPELQESCSCSAQFEI
jgi:hypothetical protein